MESYAVISDMHEADARMIFLVLDFLKNEKIKKIILNGDISGNRSTMSKQDYLAFVLEACARSGLEVFVLPGSHESANELHPVLNAMKSSYKNLIDALEVKKIKGKDHEIIFLGGSDVTSGDVAVPYWLGKDEKLKTGFYTGNNRNFYFVNMLDLKQLVSDPEKTVVISHVPRRFKGLEAVDVARFTEKKRFVVEEGKAIELSSVITTPGPNDKAKVENRGNLDLKKLYDEVGIKKAISGHFHDCVGRAHTSLVKPVEQDKWVKEIFWNASFFDRGCFGIFTAKENKIKYVNLQIP